MIKIVNIFPQKVDKVLQTFIIYFQNKKKQTHFP